MLSIRIYTKEDYSILQSWYSEYNQLCPIEADLPPTTFFVQESGNPIAAVSLYLTNCKALGWIENLVGAPGIQNRKEAVQVLISFIEDYSRECGVKRLFGFTKEEALSKRYTEMGYMQDPKPFLIVSKEL